jgi:drug/metabolite transporter, DME family
LLETVVNIPPSHLGSSFFGSTSQHLTGELKGVRLAYKSAGGYGLPFVIMLAILLALFGSFWFAFGMVLINRGVLHIDYFRGLLANLAVNALFVWLYVFFFIREVDLWRPVNLIFVIVGIFVPGVARYLIFRSMERLGAPISSCLSNSGPLFAIVIAVAFLGEQPTITNILGAFSIVGGIIALSWKGATKTWRTRDLIYPITAAFLFATRDNLVRFAVVQIPSPVLGAALAAGTSFLVMSTVYLGFGEKKPVSRAAARGLVYFALSGFMNFLSYVLTYTALAMERVSIISPLVNGSSLFVLPLTYLLLHEVEKLTMRKVAATLLVIAGVFLIAWEKF